MSKKISISQRTESLIHALPHHILELELSRSGYIQAQTSTTRVGKRLLSVRPRNTLIVSIEVFRIFTVLASSLAVHDRFSIE